MTLKLLCNVLILACFFQSLPVFADDTRVSQAPGIYPSYGQSAAQMTQQTGPSLPMDPAVANALNMATIASQQSAGSSPAPVAPASMMGRPTTTQQSQTGNSNATTAGSTMANMIQSGPDVTSQPAGVTVTGNSPNTTETVVSYSGNSKYININSVSQTGTPDNLTTSTKHVQESYEWNSQTRAWALKSKTGMRMDSQVFDKKGFVDALIDGPNARVVRIQGHDNNMFILTWDSNDVETDKLMTQSFASRRIVDGVVKDDEDWTTDHVNWITGYKFEITKGVGARNANSLVYERIVFNRDGSRTENITYEDIPDSQPPMATSSQTITKNIDPSGGIKTMGEWQNDATWAMMNGQRVQTLSSFTTKSTGPNNQLLFSNSSSKSLDPQTGKVTLSSSQTDMSGVVTSCTAIIDEKTGVLIKFDYTKSASGVILTQLAWNTGDPWNQQLHTLYQTLTGTNPVLPINPIV